MQNKIKMNLQAASESDLFQDLEQGVGIFNYRTEMFLYKSIDKDHRKFTREKIFGHQL